MRQPLQMMLKDSIDDMFVIGHSVRHEAISLPAEAEA
jgi:hypothetical protein